MTDLWRYLARGDPYFAHKVIAVVLLVIFVRRFRKPWLATVLLTALLIGLELAVHRPPVRMLLHGLIYLVISGAIFWTVDRMPHPVLVGAIAAGGIMALTWFI